jgi:cytochrome c oxidase subunit 2
MGDPSHLRPKNERNLNFRRISVLGSDRTSIAAAPSIGWIRFPLPELAAVAIPTALVTLLIGMALVLAGLWVGENVSLLPQDASSNAPVYDSLFQVLFSIGTILFIGIVGLLVFSLVRFRRRPGESGDGAAIEGNLPLEILWTAIPAVVVLFVGIYSYDIYERMGGMAPLNHHDLAPQVEMAHRHAGKGGNAMVMAAVASGEAVGGVSAADSPPDSAPQPRIWGGIGVPQQGAAAEAVSVDLTAMQFAFIFHYPDTNIISGELHVPAGRTVELHMEARDVIHAFWVPQFRLKQDVIPGQPTVLSFIATRPGSYPIVCAELCGPYHGGMRSTVVVHEPDAYEAWLSQNTPPASPTVANSGTTPTA